MSDHILQYSRAILLSYYSPDHLKTKGQLTPGGGPVKLFISMGANLKFLPS